MSKPRVTTDCVANRYADVDERIIEFYDRNTRAGGLILFRSTGDGRLLVQVYNTDANVDVEHGTPKSEGSICRSCGRANPLDYYNVCGNCR